MEEFRTVKEDPTDLVEHFNGVMTNLMNECFKWHKKTVLSTDVPWMMPTIKKKMNARNKTFQKEHRSAKWKAEKKETGKLLSNSKRDYYDRIRNKLQEEGSHTLP